ncbi:MAG: 4-(cytidine 5'-diphospho)-2-C-methyl-D-erythritol kinase [bacterium]|nr:4-(cytidine 5'-diphospho)-2-C-methyl-D-erythritol kinase [bacterium]
MKVKANAKINLYLDILSKRSDGYHNIKTVIQEISLADELEIIPNGSGEIRLKITGPFAIPVASNNLIFRACKLVRKTFGITEGVNISLKKNIPVGAGLGGGSSDAAATVKALAKLWHLDISRLNLSALGADVPFFIFGGRMLAEGIGTKLTPIGSYQKQNIILVYPDMHISTKDAYKNLNLELTTSKKKCSITYLFNKFEDSIFKAVPKVKKIKKEIITLGAEAALMSGSGSSVFGIVSSSEAAESIKIKLTDKHKKYSVWNLNTL